MGKEFWLGYGNNILFTAVDFLGNLNSQTLIIYLSTEQAATVTVSVNGTAWNQTVNIPANAVNASIIIPKSGINDARILTEGLSQKGIHIVSNVPIVVFAHQYATQSSGSMMLMPVETFGYKYVSLNYEQISNFPNSMSWFFMVASEDNTRIEITPSDTTLNGWVPNQTYTINLNKGQIYNVFGKPTATLTGLDLTGSKAVSIAGADGTCHPFGFFSGSSRNTLQTASCQGNFNPSLGFFYNAQGGEVFMQQMFPANAWGTKYVTYQTVNNTGNDIVSPYRTIYRVAVQKPNVPVKRNGIPLTGLVRNFYYEFYGTGGEIIESDEPIMVAQYMVNSNQCNPPVPIPNPYNGVEGDPEMIYLSPIQQGVKRTLYYETRKESITNNFVNIILPTTGLPSLRFDGNPLLPTEIIPHPKDPNYTVVVHRSFNGNAQHLITCDEAFVSINYGWGAWESYGYNAGCLVNNLNAICQIRNAFNPSQIYDTVSCRKTPINIFAKIAYKATKITWHLSSSSCNGISPNVDSIINYPIPIDSSFIGGRKYYTYTLKQDFQFASNGTYYVPITYNSPDIDNCNQTETQNLEIIVKENPKADFSFTNPLCQQDSVRFTGIILNANGFNITQYKWDFADGTTAITQNAVKKFTTSGIQNVRYRIIADNGCVGDTTKPVTIYDSPKSNFTLSPTSICTKDSVLITDASTIALGTITNYKWDFGDGTPIVNKTTNTPFYHTYNNANTYTIKLVTNSNNNCNGDTAVKTLIVKPRAISNFGIDRGICVNDSIRLTDSTTTNGLAIANYYWSFGDGTTLIRNTNTPFYHPYTTAGTFIVSMVAISTNGCNSDTMKRTVTVSAKPTSTISFVGKPCKDSSFLFTANYPFTTTQALRYHWNFGDGQISNISSANTVAHSYTNVATNIIVKHIIDLGGGCYSDTVTTTIPFIHNNPTASFNLNKDTLCTNFPIQITGTSTPNVNWLWNFGNGTGTQAPPITRNYATAGNYIITAKVTDANGCGSTLLTDNININAVPIVNVGPDVTIQTGSSTTLNALVTPNGSYNITWSPSLGLSSTNTLTTIATPTISTVYKIKVQDPIGNCFAQDELLVQIIDKLYIPNAFTPNKDGKNDTWNLLGLALYPNATVTIFDRWGQKIVEAKNYATKPWDGTYKGKDVPTGTYIYYIQLNNTTNEKAKGTLMVIR
jgi:gliding motility-associated-like protein